MSAIAECASCVPDTTQRHLEWLAGIGVVELILESPIKSARNEWHFEWLPRKRLEALSRDKLGDALAEITDRDSAFRERFDAASPAAVDAFEDTDHDDVEKV